MYNIPILFILFNRLDTTEQVFEQIRKQKPKYLYIAADGPRKNKEDDVENCRKTREIVNKIDWDCELKTLFRDENLGCGKAVSGAITWFFENVEMGIILEDDCLPHEDFFPYCEELLIKYKDDERISIIAGNNCEIYGDTDASYYFSAYCHVWGWASWRRSWSNYHYDINVFSRKELISHINKFCSTLEEKIYWYYRVDMVKSQKVMKKRKINTWDYQAVVSYWMKDCLSILPQKCLITNVGFTEGATHTSTTSNYNSFKSHPIMPLKYNNNIVRDAKADTEYYLRFTRKRLWKYLLLYPILWIEKIF